MIVSIKDEEAKCGVILRGANKKATFNYSVKQRKNGDPVRIRAEATDPGARAQKHHHV